MKRIFTLRMITAITIFASLIFIQNAFAQCPTNGNADVVTSQSGVVNPGNALGAADGSQAQLWDASDQIVLDLTDQIPSAEDYTIRWRKDPGTSSDPNVTVEESSNGSSWSAATGSPFTLTNTSYYDQAITASTNTRYLRFTSNNVYNLDLDAVSYDIACGGGGGGSFSCSGGLLTNPEFESDLTGWWTNGTVAITGDAQFGSKAAVISGSGAGGVGDNLAASPGQSFSLSVYGKSTGNAIVALEFLNSSWSNIQSTNESISSSSYGEYTINATAPANTAYVQILAWQNAGGGTTTVDGFCLTQVVSATYSCSNDLITNPDFESGNANWNETGTTAITGDSYYGSNAAEISGSAYGSWVQNIDIDDEKIYNLTFQAKETGSATVQAILKFVDAGWNQTGWTSTTISGSSYDEYFLSGYAPANTAKVQVILQKSATSGAATFDGICLDSMAAASYSCAGNSADLTPSYGNYIWSQDEDNIDQKWMDYDNADLALCDNGDGTFTIKGTIMNGHDAAWGANDVAPCGANDAWYVEINIFDRQSWDEFQGNYVQNTGCGANRVDWDFWDLDGTMTGLGCNSGRTIDILRPSGGTLPQGYRLQVGRGGNSQSCDFGLSTWFYGEESGNPVGFDIYAQIDSAEYISVTRETFSCGAGVFNNPEFESGFSSWTTSGTTSIVTDSYFGGSAAHIAGGTNGGGFWQFQPASEGDQFEASVYGKVLGGSSAALGILFYDASYNILNSQYQTFTNTSYTEITISSVAAPANTAYVRVSGWKNSGGNGTATFDGFCVELAAPPAPQPAFTCDNKMYQSILLEGDYWLYEVQTEPVNLIPLVNLNAAGAVGGLNGMVFRKQDGYIYIINMTSPWNLYRIGSDYSVQNMGSVSGFDANAYINAADVDANGDIIYKSHHIVDRSLNLYTMDFATRTATMTCDFPFYSGHRNNVGDIALNPQNGKYYGTWDSTSKIVEIDPATCVLNEITSSRWFPGSNGAFWVSADGTGYGYENFTGNLTEINLTTGDVEIIGTGATTSQTDGCSCEALEINNTVDVDTTVEGDTVIYTFTVHNNWHTHLSTVLFTDTLCDGMEWASEPFDKTGGILIGGTSIKGNNIANFTINQIPKGICSFSICAKMPIPYTGDNQCNNRAWLDDLPVGVGAARKSDNPRTAAIDDPTPMRVLSVDDCIGDYNKSTVHADFSWNYLAVEASADKPIQNVVLEFGDGSTEMISGLGVAQYRGTFMGTGANTDKCIAGAWIRTSCNESGEGPQYGVYQANRYWDGYCITNNAVTVIESNNHHGSSVTGGSGPQVYDWNGPQAGGVTGTGPSNDNSHGSGAADIEQPEIPGRDRTINIPETQLSVYPNPAKSNSIVNVRGLGISDWKVHIYALDGKNIDGRLLYVNGNIDISQLNLVSGIYFLEFENGIEHKNAKLIVQ